VSTILNWRDRGERHHVSTCNVHTVMQCRRTPALRRRVNSAGLVTPDGMPLVWLLRSTGRPVSRVYGPDLMLALCRAGLESGLRHYFYGGAPGVPERLADRLQRRFPSLQVAGTISPPFRELTPEEDETYVRQVNQARPDIVWVGLGTPKQDYWVADHVGRLNATALIAVGAAFDFHSGRLRQAPRWIQHSGAEWLYRLVQEPRRLWRRYLIDNALFAVHLALQRSGLRTYPLD
jgi:N-acetylglucosaminyldiphosphoundecaprenol N-acetyl-beta-D-mannosaminyltransferase